MIQEKEGVKRPSLMARPSRHLKELDHKIGIIRFMESLENPTERLNPISQSSRGAISCSTGFIDPFTTVSISNK